MEASNRLPLFQLLALLLGMALLLILLLNPMTTEVAGLITRYNVEQLEQRAVMFSEKGYVLDFQAAPDLATIVVGLESHELWDTLAGEIQLIHEQSGSRYGSLIFSLTGSHRHT